MRYRKLIALILVFLFTLSNAMVYVQAAGDQVATEESGVIYIYDADDLISLSKRCAYDQYSVGKTVFLQKNIDLLDSGFKGIPSFGGTFYGNDYTISGLQLDDKGSNYGMFRYIQQKGVVMDIHVEGTVNMSGSKSKLGGIVGKNFGTVINCSFNGFVNGVNYIGGIAGINETTGKILESSTFGVILGEHQTGGIAGENYGYISDCKNYSNVNTSVKSTVFELEDINMAQIGNNEIIISDTGGITGANTGIIKNSANYGSIGYPHFGYNVAGIAGRQSGFITGCYNEGTVFGRKDVAGIVGQMEPDVIVRYSKDFLDELSGEMELMQEEINTALKNSDSSNAVISSQFNALNDSLSQSANYLDEIVKGATDYADDTSNEVNEVVDRMEQFIKDMESVTSHTKDVSGELISGFAELEEGFKSLEEVSDHIGEGLEDVNKCLNKVNKGLESIDNGFADVEIAITHLKDATENNESLEQAFDELKLALELLQSASEATSSGLTELLTALVEIDSIDDFLNIDIDYDVVSAMEKASKNFALAFKHLELALSHINDEYTEDMEEISSALIYIEAAMKHFSEGSGYLSSSLNDFNNSIIDFKAASDDTGDSMEAFSDGMDHFEKASKHLNKAIEKLEAAVSYQVDQEDIDFPSLGYYIAESNDKLFESLDQVSEDIRTMSDTVSKSSDTLTNDLQNISDRFFTITDLIQGAINDCEAAKEELYKDISEEGLVEDVNNNYLSTIEPVSGYVVLCENTGDIAGDINIGGIAGAMAIEVDFDPEGEYTSVGDSSFNFQFQAKAVLANSKNIGNIQSKKDYVGGIVGRGDIGSVINCENYSLVESTAGNYIGGIAGGSYSVIRNGCSMSTLKGMDYIGGITGYGTNVYECKSMIHILENDEWDSRNNHDVSENSEKLGTVAGDRDSENGEMINNVFVESSWHGVDFISYVGSAEPLSYENFVSIEGLPNEFKDLYITFIINENHKIRYPFAYGDAVDLNDFPPIPEKEGYYGRWLDYDYGYLVYPIEVEVEYIKLLEVLATEEEGQAKFLVEGSFTPTAKFVSNLYKDTFDTSGTTGVTLSGTAEEQWELQITGDYVRGGNYRYRIFQKPEEDRIVYIKTDDGWSKADTYRDGSYIVFTSESDHIYVTLFKETKQPPLMLIFIGVAVVAAVICFTMRRKKKAEVNLEVSENN